MNRAGEGLPPGVQIAFHDDMTEPKLRRAAERSVATLLAHSADAVARARAAEARRSELVAALNAPVAKLIEADAAAVKALDELRTEHLFDVRPTDALNVATPYDPNTVSLRVALRAPVQVRVPPYDFAWSWSNGNAPFNQVLVNATGRVGLDARSGSMPGGASGFVEAHAGFGLILSTSRTVTVTGRSFRRMKYSYEVRAVGVGGNATSEGGMEFTALEDGRLVASASEKLWRHRVSATYSSGFDEHGAGGEGPYAVTEPRELVFTMNPGHEYTFNVGIWVFTDRSTGAGAAAAQSLLQGNVLAITVERP
ncbi:MAG: hypothetical protein M3O34_08805 [Chloroflexota bacterium]|nr:hypothetical protein [Chloroflexota bacterium]